MTAAGATAFAAALLVCLVATPVARRLALRLAVLDMPAQRKSHAVPVPVLGGLAIVTAFVCGALAAHASGAVEDVPGQTVVIVAGAVLVACLGLRDDVLPLSAGVRASFEAVLAVGLFAAGLRADVVSVWPVDLAITVAWVVGVTNAVNYLDNMDGLSAGITAVAATSLWSLAGLSGASASAVLVAALAGAAVGFLAYNRPPARIFMGDGGSLFLGFVLAAVSLQLHFDRVDRLSLVVAAAVLAVPLADAVLVSLLRWRSGIPVLQAGRDHLSHRLVRLGLPVWGAVGVLCVAGAVGAAVAWAIAYGPLGSG